MNQQTIMAHIAEAQKGLETVLRLLARLKAIDTAKDFDRFQEQAVALALRSEVLTLKLRQLVIDTAFIKPDEYHRAAGNTQGITISQQKEWLKVTMPFLLPSKSKSKYNSDFIVLPLDRALKDFLQTAPAPRLRECVLIFRYIYPAGVPQQMIRDHDNIEVKKVIDVLTDNLLIDDSGWFCSHFFTSVTGSQAATEIYIMPLKELKTWLENH